MSETREPYCTGVLQSPCNPATMDIQRHSDFVDVRTRGGKLIFRLDPVRMLVEWRDGRNDELIDLMPYLTR